MLRREVLITKEGTKTLHIPEWNESYHSKHGILQEAEHVFINQGFNHINLSEIHILEIGFGTGLNALLSLKKAMENNTKVNYHTLEKYPVSIEEVETLEYWKLVPESMKTIYFSLHKASWEQEVKINDQFTIKKYNKDFLDLKDLNLSGIDLVYHDAFGARVQPDFWEENMFLQIYNTMKPNSLLTTYSSKGSARRAMQAVGFTVEKIPGPEGKREMVNAWKK